MKKSFLVVLLMLTLLLCLYSGGVVFAEEITDGETAVTEPQTDKVAENIRIIAIYTMFVLSLLVGIPVLKRINKRNRISNSENLAVITKREADRINELITKNRKLSSKEVLRIAFYLNLLAERVLTVYTEEQIDGYLDVYNNILRAREKLLSSEKKKGEEYEKTLDSVNRIMQAVTAQVDFIIEREKKINQYNE